MKGVDFDMKSIITNNVLSSKLLILSAKEFINPVAILRDVKLVYETDANGKRTDKVVAVKYDCIDPETYSTFSIKVEGNKPVITPTALELSESIVTLEIPVNETLIKPYELSYGNCKVSIVAPYVTIKKK
jgi:hypothetical protein